MYDFQCFFFFFLLFVLLQYMFIDFRIFDVFNVFLNMWQFESLNETFFSLWTCRNFNGIFFFFWAVGVFHIHRRNTHHTEMPTIDSNSKLSQNYILLHAEQSDGSHAIVHIFTKWWIASGFGFSIGFIKCVKQFLLFFVFIAFLAISFGFIYWILCCGGVSDRKLFHECWITNNEYGM